jgi:tRNA-dihydrouridine synthase B
MGNGDIVSVSSYRKKLGNLDGVFVARGTFGDPWILGDILEYSKNREEYDKLSDEELDERFPRADKISWEKKKPVVYRHCELSVQTKGERVGMLEIRKHLAAYIKGLPGARELREKLVRVENLDQVKEILDPIH